MKAPEKLDMWLAMRILGFSGLLGLKDYEGSLLILQSQRYCAETGSSAVLAGGGAGGGGLGGGGGGGGAGGW